MTTKMKEQLPADEVGMLLHTALRKVCDSTMTSVAWNIVHLLSDTWEQFSKAVVAAGAATGPDLKAVFVAHEWRPGHGVSVAGESFYARQIFEIALSGFDDADWEGFAVYLEEQR